MPVRQPWDEFFVDLAQTIASRSKDPSTKVGAVIVRPDKTVASMGYNGFPRGVPDASRLYEDRQLKYKYVVHAEANAIVTAREPLHGCTIYTTLPPCNECAKLIIQCGISRVVCAPATPELIQRLGESFGAAAWMMETSGVAVDELKRRG